MNNEIRQASPLSQELETQIFDLQDKAWEFLEQNKTEEALSKIQEAWNLLPEPKFNTSCSHIILCDLIPFFNVSGKYSEAKSLVNDWIFDLKNSGFRIYETTPFLLLGETHLHLSEIEEAKSAFQEAVKFGATKRDFSEKPDFYFEIAKKKITDNDEIKKLFKNKCRIVSPSDYYVYYVKVENIEESLKFYNLQRKFLGPEVAKLELHDYEKFYDREHGLYLGSSIEAFGCLPSIK